jgi:uncharacterized membrane protein YfcA
VQPAPKKLSISAILFGILGGIIGIGAGLFLGFALGAVLAAALHVPSREGEAGYSTVAIALIVTCIVTPVSILVTLYWRGVRSIWLFIGLVMVCVSIAATEHLVWEFGMQLNPMFSTSTGQHRFSNSK